MTKFNLGKKREELLKRHSLVMDGIVAKSILKEIEEQDLELLELLKKKLPDLEFATSKYHDSSIHYEIDKLLGYESITEEVKS